MGSGPGTEGRNDCEIRAKLPEINPLNPYCQWDTPWLTQVKALGSYTIPVVDVQFSATIQSIPGVLPNQQTNVIPTGLAANWNVTNAQIQPSLGRPLSGGAANVSVNIIESATLYGDRTNQVDLRIAKILRFGARRLQVGLDIYNATNTNAIQNYNQTFGAAWLTPTSILTARFAKISAQFDF